MYKVDFENNELIGLESCKLSDFNINEPKQFQEWIAKCPDVFKEDLLIIQKEFRGFGDTNERPDLLALDKSGNLVVIENKLDNPGKNVVWQALKYASYCSQLSPGDIREIFQDYSKSIGVESKAEDEIKEFLGIEDKDFAEIDLNTSKTQRIILIAVNFPKEVTSTVLWLKKFEVNIECFRVAPYTKDQKKLYLVIERIIPFKDAEDFMIRMEKKEKAEVLKKQENERLEQDRLEFWQLLLDKINETECDNFKDISPQRLGAITAGSGVDGVKFKFEATTSGVRTGLYIYIHKRGRDPDERESDQNKRKNKRIFEILKEHKESVDRDFAGNLQWDPMEKKDACRIRCEAPGNVSNRNEWDTMVRFMVESMVELVRIFKPILDQEAARIEKSVKIKESI